MKIKKNVNKYEEKISLLGDLTKALYDECPFKKNLIYIDGGECTGTTTVTIEICKEFSNVMRIREPSEENYSKIKELLGKEDFATNGVNDLIDAFMEDRRQVQSKLKKNFISLSDRGIFSTIIYQSGILDNSNSLSVIEKNCETIYNVAMEKDILMPEFAIFFIHRDVDVIMKEIFEYRLNQRIERDNMDEVNRMILISNVYSDLFGRLRDIQSVKSVDLTKDRCFIKHLCINHIREAGFKLIKK